MNLEWQLELTSHSALYTRSHIHINTRTPIAIYFYFITSCLTLSRCPIISSLLLSQNLRNNAHESLARTVAHMFDKPEALLTHEFTSEKSCSGNDMKRVYNEGTLYFLPRLTRICFRAVNFERGWKGVRKF